MGLLKRDHWRYILGKKLPAPVMDVQLVCYFISVSTNISLIPRLFQLIVKVIAEQMLRVSSHPY